MLLSCFYISVLLKLPACRASARAGHASGSIWATDVPAWITAAGTGLLAILAIFTVIYAIKAFDSQSKEVGALIRQRNRETDERRRAQAAQVFTGAPAESTEEGGPITGSVPYAKNASDLPIYDAEFWWDDYEGLSEPDHIGVILPGEDIYASGKRIPFGRDYALSQVILTFSDAAGFRWIRMPDGLLIQQSRAHVRESLLAVWGLPDGYRRLADQITGSIVDAIVVHPQRHGELRLPGEFNLDPNPLRRTGNIPPEREISLTSEDGSTQGVYTRSRRIGPLERYSLVWDVWNHRDSPVTATIRLPGKADQRQGDTPRG